MSEDQPRYASLQDYLRVLRRHRILIAMITVVCAAAALGLALTKSPVYRAAAQVSFRDVLDDVDIISGDDSLSDIPAPQRAARNAELLTNPSVIRRVKAELGTDVSADELASQLETTVRVQTNLVVLAAVSGDPQFAADLANAFAREARIIGTREELGRLELAKDIIKDELEAARQDLPATNFQYGVALNQMQRVRTLSKIAEPVRIEDRATVPGAPFTPKPGRNAILGSMVGLIFGLVAAFVRESLDRRIRGAQDIHQELDMPVLGRVGNTAFGYNGLIANGRLPMLPEDFEAFRVLRTNLGFLQEGGPRSVLVTSSSPEEGKSTVSIALASAAAVAGQRVLLVETDLRRPCFARRLEIPPHPGLTDYLLGRVSPQDILSPVNLIEPPRMNGAQPRPEDDGPPASLVCIPAGSDTARPAELLNGPRFQQFLAKVTKAYDLVVLDTSPLLAVVDPVELAAQVDVVLLCVRIQQTTREQVKAAKGALAHVPDYEAGAVVTGLRRNDPDGYNYYYGY